jgi:putative transposase
MGRSPRVTEPGIVYHVLNRRVMRLRIFEKDGDYQAFERVLAESMERPDAPRLLAYCLMPNHWHLVLQARKLTNLSTWMQWVTVTHTHRWHTHFGTTGEGPLYQGRFKSFPVQADDHFLTLCRYVEANPARANLVDRAELWPWGSLWVRQARGALLKTWLHSWPVDRPRNWQSAVNVPLDEAKMQTLRRAVARGVPLGSERWRDHVAVRLGLEITLRPRGRPRKNAQKSS